MHQKDDFSELERSTQSNEEPTQHKIISSHKEEREEEITNQKEQKSNGMKKVTEHIIISFLTDAGFKVANRQALEEFKDILEYYLVSIMKFINSVTRHSQRSSSSFLDFNMVDKRFLEYLKVDGLILNYDQEEVVEESDFISPISSSIEKFIHIYDFMPNFPPVHAFKQTLVKNNEKEGRSYNVKNRLDQSLRSEKNLLKLIKASDSMPKFINYHYRNMQ